MTNVFDMRDYNNQIIRSDKTEFFVSPFCGNYQMTHEINTIKFCTWIPLANWSIALHCIWIRSSQMTQFNWTNRSILSKQNHFVNWTNSVSLMKIRNVLQKMEKLKILTTKKWKYLRFWLEKNTKIDKIIMSQWDQRNDLNRRKKLSGIIKISFQKKKIRIHLKLRVHLIKRHHFE